MTRLACRLWRHRAYWLPGSLVAFAFVIALLLGADKSQVTLFRYVF